jgi:DNA-binding SARP family transcriptional activator
MPQTELRQPFPLQAYWEQEVSASPTITAHLKSVLSQTTAPKLSLRMLGEIQLLGKDVLMTGIAGTRLQSLLAYLVLHSDRPQSRTRLASLFWPNSSEAQAHANLRNLVYLLRKTLLDADQWLHVDRHTLLWRSQESWTVDVLGFESALARAEQAEYEQDSTAMRLALEQAVALYQGELLPGCYDEWILAERDRLFQVFIAALERLLCLWEQAGNYSSAILIAHRLLREDLLHEAEYRHLMRLYAASGNQAAVVRTYRSCVTVLERELAVGPSQSTRLLYEELVQSEQTRLVTSMKHAERGLEVLPARC